MSRRRKALPYAKREKDLAVRRVKVFCTGPATAKHGPAPVGTYVMRDAGRVDLDSFLDAEGLTPGLEIARGRRVLPLRACDRCPEYHRAAPEPLDYDAVRQLLFDMPPGTTLRLDAVTMRVLSS